MCQRLYLASRTELPTVERGPGSPYLRVRPLTGAASGVRRWFSRDAKHFAEAYGSSPSDCGCGFPEVSDGGNDRPVNGDDAKAVSALATYLERRPGRKTVAEVLLCWVGDEDDTPRHSREIDLASLRAPGFRFRRGEILRLRAGTPVR
jgi:hypothetical protein